MNPILAAIFLATILWLTGCADTSWNAGMNTEPIDLQSSNPIIPKATMGISGKF